MSAQLDRIEIYAAPSWFHVDQHLVYHWSYISSNGRILADSGQGYSRRIDALHGARRVTGLDLAAQPDSTQDGRHVWQVTR